MAHAFYTKYWATLSSSINLVAISFLTKRSVAMLKSNVEQCLLRLQEFWAMSFLKKNAGNECLADLLCLPEFWCQSLFSQRDWWQGWRRMSMLSLSTRIFVAMSFFSHKEIGGGVEESLSPLQFWCCKECWRRNVELCYLGSSSEFLWHCLSSQSDWQQCWRIMLSHAFFVFQNFGGNVCSQNSWIIWRPTW